MSKHKAGTAQDPDNDWFFDTFANGTHLARFATSTAGTLVVIAAIVFCVLFTLHQLGVI